MSERIMTLFGEEMIPEQPKTPAKSRPKKNAEDKKDEAQEEQPATLPVLIPEAEIVPATKEAPQYATAQTETAEASTEPTIATITEAAVAPPATNAEEQPANAIATPHNEVAEDTATPKKQGRTKAAEEHINLPEDWQGDKQYYAIGDVAELFKVKTSHIRFWTNEFKLKVRTTRKGDRLYTPDQIRELRTIHHLVKERGFTLSGAKAKLKEQNSIDVQTVDLKQSLTQLRNKLIIIKNQLT